LIKKKVRKGKFELTYRNTYEHIEDAFTKPLKFDRFKRPGERLTLVCVWGWIKGEY